VKTESLESEIGIKVELYVAAYSAFEHGISHLVRHRETLLFSFIVIGRILVCVKLKFGGDKYNLCSRHRFKNKRILISGPYGGEYEDDCLL
jgi:hypothetical protein